MIGREREKKISRDADEQVWVPTRYIMLRNIILVYALSPRDYVLYTTHEVEITFSS